MPAMFEKYSDLMEFTYAGRTYAVEQTGSLAVAHGVVCDTYSIDITEAWDLGIIKVDAGCRTPRQLVAGGDQTIEMYLAGKGYLSITPATQGSANVFSFEPDDLWTADGNEVLGGRNRCVSVDRGDVMQWTANGHVALVAAELCWPPYADGRFEDLS